MVQSINTAFIILAAGHGTRMQSALPKVLHPIGGLPMLGHVLKTASGLAPDSVSVVVGGHSPTVSQWCQEQSIDVQTFVQSPPQGTGDAVRCAMPAIDAFEGIVFVLYADTPLIPPSALLKMKEMLADEAGIVVIGFRPDVPGGYGRLDVSSSGIVDRIVEANDATDEELQISLCNSGVMAFRAEVLKAILPQINNENDKEEYYLTDAVGLAKHAGHKTAVLELPEEDVIGVNSRVELSKAEGIFQARMRNTAMLNGATLLDPDTVYFSHDTKIEPDATVGQNVVFGPGVSVGRNVKIKPFSHLEGVAVHDGAIVGPFARLRPGTIVGPEAKIGNFVETKKASIGAQAKISHLSYIGDAEVGADANIGAGTITCNYDGFDKFQTVIEEGAFVGSNSSLVAPVRIGKGAYVGSGSVVTKDVEDDALAVARGKQFQKTGWALQFRKKKTS